MGKTKRTKEQIIQAIQGSRGIKTHISARLKICRQTLDKYIRQWPEVAEAYEIEEGALLDSAESTLYRLAIEEGSEKSLLFLLERKGRSRGYGRHQEHQHQLVDFVVEVGKGEENS